MGLLLAFGAVASGQAPDALLRRYPYDPACPWGRISNGKGMILRCVSESEAQALRAGAVPAQAATTTTGAPPNGSAPTASAPPALAATAPAASASADDANDSDGNPPSVGADIEVTVGPVTADSGQLGVGKLGAPRDRYVKCLLDNGGLKDKTAEVHVRFLVQKRGRAEGVSVVKRVNVSAEAARCVSEVVDRRYVGVPEAPIVGATVLVKFAKVGK
ncbi:MAG TPA: hypothetical protein VGM29_18740 [Polyangiaceae bacterium]|jgi:hypothetical protein